MSVNRLNEISLYTDQVCEHLFIFREVNEHNNNSGETKWNGQESWQFIIHDCFGFFIV